MLELFNFLSGCGLYEMTMPDENEDEDASILEPEEESGDKPEPLNVDEKLKDEAWAAQPVTFIQNGKPVSMTRGEFHRQGMKNTAGDEKLRRAHEKEASLSDLMGTAPDRSDSRLTADSAIILRDVHDIANSVRKDKAGKPVSRTMREIFADDALSMEQKMAEAAPILDAARETSGSGMYSDPALRNEVEQMRTERAREARTEEHRVKIVSDWAEVVKAYPYYDTPQAKKNILGLHGHYDQVAAGQAALRGREALNQGYSPEQVAAAWPRIIAEARAEHGKSIKECADFFEQVTKERNRKVVNSRRSGTAGPGTGAQPSSVRRKLVDKDGNPLQMGTPGYDKAVAEML